MLYDLNEKENRIYEFICDYMKEKGFFADGQRNRRSDWIEVNIIRTHLSETA